MKTSTHPLPVKCAGFKNRGPRWSHRDLKVSCCLIVCSEEGRKGLLSSLVCICTEWHRLCTTPSLVWPGGIFQISFVTHQHHPVDGGQSHSLCLCQSSLLCSELEDHSSCSSQRPNSNPEPFHLPPLSYTLLPFLPPVPSRSP